MALTRLVNGKKVELSAAEESAFLAESAANAAAKSAPLAVWQRDIEGTETDPKQLYRFMEDLLTARGDLTDLPQEMQDWHANRVTIRGRRP